MLLCDFVADYKPTLNISFSIGHWNRDYFRMKIIVICCLWISVSAGDSDSSYIPSDWVDPTDMRNYNRQTKSMKSPTAQVAGTKDEDVDNSTNYRHLNDEVERFEIFLQRFINRVLLTADLKVSVSYRLLHFYH